MKKTILITLIVTNILSNENHFLKNKNTNIIKLNDITICPKVKNLGKQYTSKTITLPTFTTKYKNNIKIINNKLSGTNRNTIKMKNNLYICKKNNKIIIKSINTLDIKNIK